MNKFLIAGEALAATGYTVSTLGAFAEGRTAVGVLNGATALCCGLLAWSRCAATRSRAVA